MCVLDSVTYVPMLQTGAGLTGRGGQHARLDILPNIETDLVRIPLHLDSEVIVLETIGKKYHVEEDV